LQVQRRLWLRPRSCNTQPHTEQLDRHIASSHWPDVSTHAISNTLTSRTLGVGCVRSRAHTRRLRIKHPLQMLHRRRQARSKRFNVLAQLQCFFTLTASVLGKAGAQFTHFRATNHRRHARRRAIVPMRSFARLWRGVVL
jgi:hypothetical protein